MLRIKYSEIIITFLIGNGFDLNLGLRTRYADFYPYFIEHAADDNMIKTWLNEADLLWSDLEEQLGQNLQKIDENNIEKFYEDKGELDELLMEYLEQEQGKLKGYNATMISEEFARSLLNFKKDLSGKDRASVEETCRERGEDCYRYQFISFNYTNILDAFINMVYERRSEMFAKEDNDQEHYLSQNVLHIHGTLDREMILGVNDTSQVNSSFLAYDGDFLDTFIKERLNRNLGQSRTETAEYMIEDSDIICMFGLSIGCTDRMWWKKIVAWLSLSAHHKLIVYCKDGCNRSPSQRIVLAKNKIKNKMKENIDKEILELYDIEEIMTKICVCYNPDIFNFKDILHL